MSEALPLISKTPRRFMNCTEPYHSSLLTFSDQRTADSGFLISPPPQKALVLKTFSKIKKPFSIVKGFSIFEKSFTIPKGFLLFQTAQCDCLKSNRLAVCSSTVQFSQYTISPTITRNPRSSFTDKVSLLVHTRPPQFGQ